MNFPTTAHALYQWNAALLLAYVAVAAAIDLAYRRGLPPRGLPADWLYNGAAFSGSATIAMGIFDETVMHLIGDTTAYLMLAVAAGLGRSLGALLPSETR